MFRSKAIYEFASLAEGIGNQNRAGKFCGEARYAERQFAELPFDFALYLPGKGGRRGDEETCRIPCVFSLGQQVRGNPARVAFCRQDNRFGWPGGQINRAISADELFGGGDGFVARPEYLFPARNQFRAGSEGSDCLGATHTGELSEANPAR